MTETELQTKLNELLALPAETEWVEFKEAKTNFHFDDLGKYFSALSNEANLKQHGSGWLVFGIVDKTRAIVGSQYRPTRPHLDSLKQEIANQTSNRTTFEEIHELVTAQGRVIMFQVPPAPRGIPVSWKGHFYGREGESLAALSIQELEEIRRQGLMVDWSAGVVEDATLDDLDTKAIDFAREQYAQKNPNHAEDALNNWDVPTFLNKAKVCISGKATRAALLLLGKPESAHFLSPAVAQVTWVLKDVDGIEQDYAHLKPPLLLASDAILNRIRNLMIRHLPSGTLFPHEVTQYDPWVLRETLHNCIAHHDYETGARINVVEMPDALLFSNRGAFIPGTVEEMIQRDAPPDVYRNSFLAQAMVTLNMIDTIGSGIRKMFVTQRKRSFPMPDFDLSEVDSVKVRLDGKVLDENYTRMLMENAGLDLMDAMALDKVQRKRELSEEDFKRLKKAGLIEGRRPNLFVSAKVAQATDDRAAYIRNRAFDKAHYRDMVVAFLGKYGEASRTDLDSLLIEKLSDSLSAEQKKGFVTNLLQEMRRDGTIEVEGKTRWAKWRMCSPQPEKGD